jgi:hypothetical protein
MHEEDCVCLHPSGAGTILFARATEEAASEIE